MDFEVDVNGETRIFEQFNDALAFIAEKMAYWNNFDPTMGLHINCEKIKGQTEVIQLGVGDALTISEH